MSEIDHIGVAFDVLRMFLALHLHDPDADLPAAVDETERQVREAAAALQASPQERG